MPGIATGRSAGAYNRRDEREADRARRMRNTPAGARAHPCESRPARAVAPGISLGTWRGSAERSGSRQSRRHHASTGWRRLSTLVADSRRSIDRIGNRTARVPATAAAAHRRSFDDTPRRHAQLGAVLPLATSQQRSRNRCYVNYSRIPLSSMSTGDFRHARRRLFPGRQLHLPTRT